MSSKKILKKLIPYVDDNHSIEEVVNYTAKTLNSAYIDTSDTTTQVGSMGFSQFIDVEFKTAGITGFDLIVVPHSLGSTPTAWIILDVNHPIANPIYSLIRTAWNSTTISLGIYNQYGLIVNYKVRVFI